MPPVSSLSAVVKFGTTGLKELAKSPTARELGAQVVNAGAQAVVGRLGDEMGKRIRPGGPEALSTRPNRGETATAARQRVQTDFSAMQRSSAAKAEAGTGYSITGGFEKFDVHGRTDEEHSASPMRRTPGTPKPPLPERKPALPPRPQASGGMNSRAGGFDAGRQPASGGSLQMNAIVTALRSKLAAAFKPGGAAAEHLLPLGRQLGNTLLGELQGVRDDLRDVLREGARQGLQTQLGRLSRGAEGALRDGAASLKTAFAGRHPAPAAAAPGAHAELATDHPADDPAGGPAHGLPAAASTASAASHEPVELPTDAPAGAAGSASADGLKALGLPRDAAWSTTLGFAEHPVDRQTLTQMLDLAVKHGNSDVIGLLRQHLDDVEDFGKQSHEAHAARFEDDPAQPQVRAALQEATHGLRDECARARQEIDAAQGKLKQGLATSAGGGTLTRQRDELDMQALKDIGRPANASPHEVLGVAPQASRAEISRAARDMMLKYHPDKNTDRMAPVLFNLAKEARDELVNG